MTCAANRSNTRGSEMSPTNQFTGSYIDDMYHLTFRLERLGDGFSNAVGTAGNDDSLACKASHFHADHRMI
jgi:hypothetical protein